MMQPILSFLMAIIVPEGLAGTPSIQHAELFRFLSNPASDHLIIEFNEKVVEGFVISIRDINGKEVLNQYVVQGTKQQIMDMSQLADDLYILTVNCGAKAVSRSLLIKR